MAENDIKTKIVLEGEKEYKQALKDANRELKTLKSELKAETAELGKNATAQEKNAVKVKNLQKQIAEQEKIVKTYRKALEEVKEKYGDNAEEVSKWEQKLNNARTTLANMKNDLEGVGDGFKTMQQDANMATVASRSAAEAIGSLGDIGGTISDSIEGIFTGMLSALRDTIGEVWSLIADTAAKANNWTDLASYYGTTAAEVERMNKAIEWTQGNFGDFTNLLNQLSWGGKGKKITEWFNVSDANYENKLEYAMAVLQEMQEMQNKDPNKLGDAMEDIFGAKKSQQIMWFVSNLDKLKENLQTYDENGFGIGEDGLSTLNDVWFTLGEIEGKWNDLKQRFAAGFGNVTLDITTKVSGTLDALSRYFDADDPKEREEALNDVKENIIGIFTNIRDAIQEGIGIVDEIANEFKDSDDPMVKTIGNLMGGLADALEWFTVDNMHNTVTALEILAGFWIAGKGLQLASTVAELAANIRTLSFFKLIGGAAGGGLGTMGETVGTTAGNSFLSVLRQGLPGVMGAALIAAGFSWAADQRKNHREEVRGTEEYLEKQTGSANNLLLDYILAQKELEGVDIVNATPELAEKLTQRVADAYNALLAHENGEEALKAYSDWRQEKSYGNMDWIVPDYMEEEETVNLDERSAEAIAEAIQDWWDAQRNAENGLEDQDEAWRALDWMQEVLGDRFGDVYDSIIKHLDEMDRDQQLGLEDIPANWWLHGDDKGEGITNENLTAFNKLPGEMKKAVKEGVSGIRVYMDGRVVGGIVADEVSRQIAAQIGG